MRLVVCRNFCLVQMVADPTLLNTGRIAATLLHQLTRIADLRDVTQARPFAKGAMATAILLAGVTASSGG